MASVNWDLYWKRAEGEEPPRLYDRAARFYRNQIISRAAASVLSHYFPNLPGRHYLHAGCGSGGSDRRIPLDRPRFHYLDLSPEALRLSRSQPLPLKRWYLCGDILSLPYASESLDGIFNFGVMEHFPEVEIDSVLSEFHRALKPTGRLVLFWPPEFGLSVRVLTAAGFIADRFRKRPARWYPDEVSRIRSFSWIRDLMKRNRFLIVALEFGLRDLWTHVIVIARKMQPTPEV